MLKVLRDSMKYLAWILWLVIAVFILFVFVDFGGGMPASRRPGQAAATVGEQEITYGEFEREYRNLEEQMRSNLGDQYTPELAEQLQIPSQALNRVVNRKILLAAARELDLTVTDEDLGSYIVSLPVFRQNGRFVGEATYDRIVRRLGYTPAGFERSMREQLLVDRLMGALESSVVVPEERLEQRYREQVEKASIRFVALPVSEVASDVSLTDAELEEYFQEHREEYRIPEERTANYLLVDQNVLREELEVTEEEITSYYEEHREEYRQKEQVRARHILVGTEDRSDEEARERIAEARTRLEAGEEFAAVARDLSDDPGSAARGGDLGFFGRGRMVPAFEEAAFGAEPGELVGPVETQFGYHLIEVQEKREERLRSLDEVRELIRNRLRATTAGERAEALAQQLRDDLGQSPTPARMEELATENPAVTFGTTEPFRRQGTVPPLGPAPAVSDAAFALQEGGVSAPVRAPRGWVVIRLSEVHPPRAPELEEVEEQVREDARRAKAVEQAGERLAEAAGAESGTPSLDAAAESLGLEIQESDPFGHGGTVSGLGRAPEVAERALSMGEGEVAGPMTAGDRAVLFEVVSRETFSPEGFARERERIAEQLRQQELNQLLSSLVNQKRRELGVTYDPQLLESFELTELAGEQG
ncbi:MAG: peptidyl-prolyl cis-trans isomerase [Thermoanaerobaculia bacterium]|nr:peptidyl-prolyl cis-trans isomerase [Thermoanaerobaculia bacterium]